MRMKKTHFSDGSEDQDAITSLSELHRWNEVPESKSDVRMRYASAP